MTNETRLRTVVVVLGCRPNNKSIQSVHNIEINDRNRFRININWKINAVQLYSELIILSSAIHRFNKHRNDMRRFRKFNFFVMFLCIS